MAETVETAIYRLQVEGADTLNRLKDSVDGLAVSEEKATASTRTYSEALQNQIARYDPVIKAIQEQSKALQTYERYAESGAGTQQQLAAYMEVTTAKAEAQSAALDKAAVATENLRRAQATAAAGPGQAVGGATGAASYAQQFEQMMAVSEGKAAQIAQNFGKELDAQMIAGTTKAARDSAAVFSEELDKIDQIAKLKAQQAGKNFQDTLNQAMGIGSPASKSARESFQVFDEAGLTGLNQGAKGMTDVANNTKLARYEMINLSYQIQDVVVGLVSGQKLFTVFIQQGSQIMGVLTSAGVGAGDAFKQVASTVMGFISPAKLAATAVVGIGAAALYAASQFDKLQVSSQRAMSGAGARTGTQIEDINKFVQQNTTSSTGAVGTSASDTQARKLAEAFTASGDIVISKLHSMNDALIGFANQTGKSVDDAIKAWVEIGKDPVKGMQQLAEAFGAMTPKQQELVEGFVEIGDKTSATNVMIDAYSKQLQNAANNMSVAAKAAQVFATTMGREMKLPEGIDTQIANVKKELDAVIATAPQMLDAGAIRIASSEVQRLSAALVDLQKKKEAALAATAQGRQNFIADQAKQATQAIFPQIQAIQDLTTKINQLKAAQAAGLGGQYGGAALQAYEQQKQSLQESLDATIRMNAQVEGLRSKWGGVSGEVAKQLETMQNTLPVAQAVGGAAKMQAQYEADINNYRLAGKTLEEAQQLAAANRAQTQAQINAGAKETLFSLQNQAAAAGAVTGAEQMAAQAAATYNQMVHDGVDANIAAAAAAQQLANAQAQATANVQRQVIALRDSTAMIEAQTYDLGTGLHTMEALTASSIAYKNAINSGADSSAAAAASAATMENYTARTAMEQKQAAIAADEQAASLDAASKSADSLGRALAGIYAKGADPFASLLGDQTSGGGGGGGGGDTVGVVNLAYTPGGWVADPTGAIQHNLDAYKQQHPYDPAPFGGGQVMSGGGGGGSSAVDQYLQQGGVDYALSQLMSGGGSTGNPILDAMGGGGATPDYSSISQLYDLKNQQITDKSQQAANLQTELAWVKSQPETLARDQSISQLTSSINSLTKSTDSLNATNSELLSPYYTQDPRTSHIGFRSQGMASGGFVDVPGGYSANDNLVASIPVASGERIFVDPMNARRGVTSNSGNTINMMYSPVVYGNAGDKDAIGRTLFQSNQAMAKQMRAALQ